MSAFVAGGIGAYAERRNAPALDGTSFLSPHLRAGTIGIRTCVDAARRAAQSAAGVSAWLGELTWRDFYQQLLVHAPRVAREPFVAAARSIRYRDDERALRAWMTGTTGYPIVDAAMMHSIRPVGCTIACA